MPVLIPILHRHRRRLALLSLLAFLALLLHPVHWHLHHVDGHDGIDHPHEIEVHGSGDHDLDDHHPLVGAAHPASADGTGRDHHTIEPAHDGLLKHAKLLAPPPPRTGLVPPALQTARLTPAPRQRPPEPGHPWWQATAPLRAPPYA